MKETLLPYAPAILAVAIAVILRLTFAKKSVNDVPFRKTEPTKGEKTLGRQILERFWEEDR